MLTDLKIANGNLELMFNEYTYEYTVTVDDDITSLDFIYDLDNDAYINIRGNILNNSENIVYIDVYSEENIITYTFYVYKGNIETVNNIDYFISSLEVSNIEQIPLYKVQLLSCSIFLILIIILTILFRKKHN